MGFFACHNSGGQARTLQEVFIAISVVNCAADGSLDPGDIERAIRPYTKLIVLNHASNVVGTILPVAEVGRIAREHSVPLLVDAAQSAGCYPIDVEAMNIDLLAFSGHKSLFGPQGTGALYIRPGIESRLEPLKYGGTGSYSEYEHQPEFLPDKYESGTPNTPGIAGLGAAARYILATGCDRIFRHEQALVSQLLEGLGNIDRVQLYGRGPGNRCTAVIAFNLEGMDCGELSMRLDHDYGITTRSGLHCAPLAHQTLGTLQSGTCRLSPGFFNVPDHIEQVIRAIHTIARTS